jgi:peptidyl-prolyl cis-trans isomerase D
MFNLFRSREKATKYLLGGMMLVLAASMLTYLTQTGLTSTTDGDQVLAEIGDQRITVQQAQSEINRIVQSGRVPADSVDLILPQYLDDAVQQRAAMNEFKKLGIEVSDEEVLTAIMAIAPQFFDKGKLVNQAGLEQLIAQRNATLQDLVDQMRESLLIHKVQNVTSSNIIITPQEVDQALTQKHQKAKIVYVTFPAAKFRDQVKPTPEELKTAFEKSKAAYAIPEKRSFQVLVVDQAKVEQSITVSDAQLRSAYAGSMDNYRMPERVKVRHILLMTQGKPDAEKKAKLTKAQDLLKQVRGGADFAELAKKNSEDPGSAQQGGDLGFIVKGQTVPEFERYAFSAKPKDISDIITTEYGYHIIQVLEKEPAKVKSFDEVKEGLATELKKQSVAEKTQMLADQVHAALEKAPGTAAEIAKQFNVELVTATKVAVGEAIPGLGVSSEIDSSVAALQPKGVSSAIVLPNNRIATVVLTERIPSRPAEFAEVEAQVRDRLVSEKSQELAIAAARSVADKVRGGEDIEKAGREAKMEVMKPAEFTQADSVEGLGQAAFVMDAFNKPVGTIVGPMNVQGRELVYKITERQPVNVQEFAVEREATINDLKQQKGRTQYQLLLDSVVTKARADGKVKIHQDTLKRLEASYRQGR